MQFQTYPGLEVIFWAGPFPTSPPSIFIDCVVFILICMTRFFKYYMNSTNGSGILVTDTWLFYKRSFDCSNFKGTGLENNYYLLRPIYLNSGELVNSKRRFIIAQQQKQLFEGIDFIVSDQHDAITAAKLIYLPHLVEPEETIIFLQKYNLGFL
jgi:hypothetical protein